MTRQKLTAILRRGHHEASKSHSTRIRGWHTWEEGYEISNVEENIKYSDKRLPSGRWSSRRVSADIAGFKLSYCLSSSAHLKDGEYQERIRAGLAGIKHTLTQAGVTFEEKGDELYIPA